MSCAVLHLQATQARSHLRTLPKPLPLPRALPQPSPSLPGCPGKPDSPRPHQGSVIPLEDSWDPACPDPRQELFHRKETGQQQSKGSPEETRCKRPKAWTLPVDSPKTNLTSAMSCDNTCEMLQGSSPDSVKALHWDAPSAKHTLEPQTPRRGPGVQHEP